MTMTESLLALTKIIVFYLCTAPCQFTISKTTQCLQYIASLLNEELENNIHNITLVFTNKSLEETKQWKSRLNCKFTKKNIVILSSKSNDHRIIDTLTTEIMDNILKNDYQKLPNVIVMCTHSKRTEDCLKLIEHCEGWNVISNFKKQKEINLTLMFDEIDVSANLTTTINFLKQINNFKDDIKKNIKSCIFITATPFKKFWEKIGDNITLQNLLHDNGIEYSVEDSLKNYRKIKDHEIEYIEDNRNPTVVAKNVLKKIKNKKNTKTVFAPAGIKVDSHNEMKDMALDYGYDVLIINGQNKSFTINKEKITINDFNKKHNINGELRDTLVKYRELYPNNNLLITGNMCIERGITFNTTGFNFTDMIISQTHAKNIPSLIQFLGRANGDIQFINKFNIWIPKHIMETAKKYIERLQYIQTIEKIDFVNSDFCDYDEEIKKKKIGSYDSYTLSFPITEKQKEKFLKDRTRSGKKYPHITKFLKNKNIKECNIEDYNIATHNKRKDVKDEFTRAIKIIENKQKFYCKYYTNSIYKDRDTCHIMIQDKVLIANFIRKIEV